MDEARCLICNSEGKHSLLWRFNGDKVSLCDAHARAYQHETDPDVLATEDQHYSILCNLIRDFDIQLMHVMKRNSKYMHNVMNSWEEGCLSNLEAVNKMILLLEETRKIAWNLKGGGE
jgi:hypothetical protein